MRWHSTGPSEKIGFGLTPQGVLSSLCLRTRYVRSRQDLLNGRSLAPALHARTHPVIPPLTRGLSYACSQLAHALAEADALATTPGAPELQRQQQMLPMG